MLGQELVVLALILCQPPIIGYALYLIARPTLQARPLLLQLRGVRRRLKSVRFFECAAYSRLNGKLQYDVHALSLCALFILYDIDLLFFFLDATTYSFWS
jgi:NADH:ubiquinone oxidoreductase subunit 3 (subunit A)